MKTDLQQLLFETLEDAQKVLSVNDPGYTIVREEKKVKVLDPNGLVVATIDEKGLHEKVLL